ncbi:MAG: hypothetical protein RNU03_07695 [Candidatus Sedimenticola sp. (ex Thyasira tokunagai)]
MPTLLPLWRAMRTTGKQCGLTATGDYQPSLRSPWLAAEVDKMAHLSAAKGGLEQKVDFTVIYSKWYYTGTHLLSPYAIATADCLLKMDHSFVEIWS